MKLLFIGDICFNKRIYFDDSILELINQVDYVVGNLEGPITNSSHKIIKVGPHLKNSSLLNKYFSGKLILSIANNHIMDFGDDGLSDTIKYLKSHNILFGGAGKNLACASKPLRLYSNNSSLSLFFRAENELNIATENTSGVAPITTTISDKSLITNELMISDNVCFYLHGGTEYNPYINNFQTSVSDFYQKAGVKKILWTHSHSISAPIDNEYGSIYPSLGNAIFEQPNNSSLPTNSKNIFKIIFGINLYNKWRYVSSTLGLAVMIDFCCTSSRDKVNVISFTQSILKVHKNSKLITRSFTHYLFRNSSKYWRSFLFFSSRWQMSFKDKESCYFPLSELLNKNQSFNDAFSNFNFLFIFPGILRSVFAMMFMLYIYTS